MNNDDHHFLMSLSADMRIGGRPYYAERCKEIADNYAKLQETCRLIANACARRTHPAGELCISENHLEDLRAIGGLAGAAIKNGDRTT